MMKWIERGFLIVGVVCLGFSAWNWLDSNLYQRAAGQRLESLLKRHSGPRHTGGGRAGGATSRDTAARDIVGRIEIPRLGISAIIAEGIDPRTLRRAVGHVPSTALPGEEGNVVLAGHRDSFFHALKDVRSGDQVKITTEEGVFEYAVDSTDVVGPQRVDLLDAAAADSLTLITCYPFNYVGPAPDRFVVHARPA
jgi:sortase A